MIKFAAICTILLGLCFFFAGKHSHISKTVALKDLFFNKFRCRTPTIIETTLIKENYVCIFTLLKVTNEYLMNKTKYIFCIEQRRTTIRIAN
jgi:hypothetical protein